jgi:N-acetylglucosaminyl-diphospho-decaprenol L-rhamnosyltransferase
VAHGAVTVVIATRDRRPELLQTLAKQESLPERPAVIVVDDGSRDGTVDAVRRLHPRVQLVETAGGLGSGARTVGARVAATPYVAFSDDDSWWAPGALTRAAALLHEHPRVGLIAACILVQPGDRIDPTCTLMEQSPLPCDPTLPGPQVLGFVACGAVVRRSAYLDCGGFEPRYLVGGEESLLAIDMACAGWRLVYAGDVVAQHQPYPGHRPGRTRRVLRNDLWTAWLRRPGLQALGVTAKLLASSGASDRVAFADAVRGLPWIVRHRRVVPPSVERALRLIER